MKTYKEIHDLATRKEKCQRVLENYPGMIPTIIEIGKKSQLEPFEQKKFAVCKNYFVYNLKNNLYKKLQLQDKNTVIFLYCQNKLLNEQSQITEVYEKYKDPEDGFLYLQYTEVESLG